MTEIYDLKTYREKLAELAKPVPILVWMCKHCHGQTWYIYEDGAIECAKCDAVTTLATLFDPLKPGA